MFTLVIVKMNIIFLNGYELNIITNWQSNESVNVLYVLLKINV